jgi:CheY-like chemotaxis protein
VSPAQRSFRVWGEGENSFAVLSTQLCSIESKEAVEIRTDARGDYMVIDNQRVPLIKLDLLYSTAPEQGDRIALIGALEKRFAFYTDGEGRIETGEWLKDAVSTWKGHLRGAAQLGHRRVPLLEAEELMSQYVMASGDRGDQEISGGVVTDEMDLSQGQATYEKDSASPPESNSSSDELDILVVERSSTVTEAFESIFKRANYKFEIVVSVEAAMAILRARPPRLIISEFRMPAMAARLIKDRMKEEGLDIPLLVTTSHSGTNAQLLVEKLGVWGYLSKPLDEETVFAKLNNCFQEKSTAV